MSRVETPDCWVVLKITAPDEPVLYKILAGWYGGYAGSDYWQINSGITNVTEKDKYIDFTGLSGSIYRCGINCQKMSSLMSSIFHNYSTKLETSGLGIMEIVPVEEVIEALQA